MTRPGFVKLLGYCEDHSIDMVIVEHSSRFARDLLIQELGYQKLEKEGYTWSQQSTPSNSWQLVRQQR